MDLPHIKMCSVIYYGAACHIDKALEIEARYCSDPFSKVETKYYLPPYFLLTMPPEENPNQRL
jgi:3-hydroxyacyl-CoA dehydrogenase/enoyl-CoA hydratase/3-hydroxybutyryl-CoA epimerase